MRVESESNSDGSPPPMSKVCILPGSTALTWSANCFKEMSAWRWTSRSFICEPLCMCKACTGCAKAASRMASAFVTGTPNLLSLRLTSNISGAPVCTWGFTRIPKMHVGFEGNRSNSPREFTLTNIPVIPATQSISLRVLTGESKTILSAGQPAAMAILTSSIEAASRP